MKYKALVLDLDGTTVPIGGAHPSETVASAIKKAEEKLHVGIATGRPLFYAKAIIESLSIKVPCIVNGGAILYDPKTGKTIWEKRLPPESLEPLMRILKNHPYSFFLNNGEEESEVINGDYPKNPLSGSIAGLTRSQADQIITEISHLPHLAFHTLPSVESGKIDVEVNHVMATKQHGIFEVARLLHIAPHEIIGVGDSGNDLPLLMACGLKVAMGNASPNLKAIADYVAPTVGEDGVADVINKFILNPQSN